MFIHCFYSCSPHCLHDVAPPHCLYLFKPFCFSPSASAKPVELMCPEDEALFVSILSEVRFPPSRRKNVQRSDKPPDRGLTLGMHIYRKTGVPSISEATRHHEDLAKRLIAWGRNNVAHAFNAIQVNHNNESALHCDMFNCGNSTVVAFGVFHGGNLFVHDVQPHGRVVDVKKRPCVFDATCAHCVMPFQGQRFSLVFFSSDAEGKQMPLNEMRRLGLDVDAVVQQQVQHQQAAAPATVASKLQHQRNAVHLAQQTPPMLELQQRAATAGDDIRMMREQMGKTGLRWRESHGSR